MRNFSAQLLKISTAYNLTPEIVGMCHAIASGCPAADAYILTHRPPTNTTNEAADQLAAELLRNNPAAKILIAKLKHQPITQQQETNGEELTEEEKDEFCTKNGLTRKIITSIRQTSGKDRVAALVTLAKLQGLDKPEDLPEEERRRYFLPWVSTCRNCKLMAIYRGICAKPDK